VVGGWISRCQAKSLEAISVYIRILNGYCGLPLVAVGEGAGLPWAPILPGNRRSRIALAPKLILRANGFVTPVGLPSPSSTAFSSKFEADELMEDTDPRRNADIPLVEGPEMLIARALCAAATLGPGYGGGAARPVNSSVRVVPGEKEALRW